MNRASLSGCDSEPWLDSLADYRWTGVTLQLSVVTVLHAQQQRAARAENYCRFQHGTPHSFLAIDWDYWGLFSDGMHVAVRAMTLFSGPASKT